MEKEKKPIYTDDFWNFSSFVKKEKTVPTYQKDTEAVSVDLSPKSPAAPSMAKAEQRLSHTDPSDTVIHRVIAPEARDVPKDSFDFCEEYAPSESPIRRVSLKKWKCAYHFYDEFLQDALRYREIVGKPAPFVPFFSYVPQYNQLSPDQLAFYLSWREDCRRGEFTKTDYSYLLLYVFELINLGKHCDTVASQRMLVDLWRHYHKTFPALEGKLSRWICDFSLIHRLSPPENADSSLVRHESVLREFFITLPEKNALTCVRSLLQYSCSYDFRTSKFATGERLSLYETHVVGALAYALQNYRGEHGFLGDFSGGESRMVRNAYEGALCCADEKWRIEIDYISFSRSNELRFFIGDVVKYIENKIRASLGIKSKLSVYSVTGELRACIDRYFEEFKSTIPVQKKKEAPREYDALYELPKKQFSLEAARQIEKESWDTTNVLISAFEEDEVEEVEVIPEQVEEMPAPTALAEDSLPSHLGKLYGFAAAVLAQDPERMRHEAEALGCMPDQIVDRINEIAVDFMGDILIEDNGEGYAILEDYADML